MTLSTWLHITIGMLGGLALMLYGIDKMSSALKNLAGDKMKQIMWRLTKNRFMGLFTGAFITATVQSSTVTTVLLIGFISTRLMSLAQSISVILGADIGTTLTAQILAFKVEEYALLPVALGFFIAFIAKKDSMTQTGRAIMGLGLVFFGVALMSQSLHPLRAYPPFTSAISTLETPFYGIFAGALFTALTNSSAATLAVVIALASQGVLTLEVSIGLTLGANIGTCLTAGIAALGKRREAMRAAAAHVLFKVLGVIIILPFLPQFAEFVRSLSPTGPIGTNSIEILAHTVPRQVANAHTLFNVGLAVIFLPFTTQFAQFLEWLIPDKPLKEDKLQPIFLDVFLISTPTLAFQAVRNELERLGQEVLRMYDRIIPALLHGSKEELREVKKLDDGIDNLYAHIISYLGQVSQQKLSPENTTTMLGLTYATHHMESIGDIIENNLVGLGHSRLEKAIVISKETEKILANIAALSRSTLQDSLRSIALLDSAAAERAIAQKRPFKLAANAASEHLTQRLIATENNRLNTFALEMDLIDKLQRIYFHCGRLSKCTLSILNKQTPKST